MASKKRARPLQLEPRISARLVVLHALAVAGAVALPFFVAMPGWSRPVLVVIALVIGWSGYQGRWGRRRIMRAACDEGGGWLLELADGSEVDAELTGESFVTPGTMVLCFRAQERRFHLVVLADTVDAETRRRLRVRLRVRRSAEAEKEGLRVGR